jgi:NADH-quinone oxidoreductase subunit N
MQHLQALLPILITGFTSVAVMLSIAIRRHHITNLVVLVIGLNAALLSLFWAAKAAPLLVTPLLMIDHFALFFCCLIIIAALACSTLAYTYNENHTRNKEELYLLMSIATLGCLVLACAAHLAALFIGLEMLSIALYGLIAYTHDRARSLEAGIKYLILSATASCVMFFGMALLYAEFGTLTFMGIGQKLATSASTLSLSTLSSSALPLIGSGFLMMGLAFKLSLAPFHLWTPDVYEGAPAPIATFLATAAKVAVFAVLVRFLLLDANQLLQSPNMMLFLGIMAALSILMGNLLALKQNNIKRMLGYSSIAHFGYLLVLLITANTQMGIEGFALYLTVYVMTSLAAFGVVTLMSMAKNQRDADLLEDYRGLFWHRPLLTSILTVALLSLAGIPLTAGFIAKFYVVNAGMNAGIWGWSLLAVVMLGSAISLFYYLNTMVNLFLAKSNRYPFDASLDWGQRTGGLIVMAATVLILLIGIYPEPLIDLIQFNLTARSNQP